MKNRRLIFILVAATFLLLIPFIAMQLTTEVKWSLSDFAIAGILLFGSALACEFVLRRFRTPLQRFAICAAVLAALVLVWLELAVGIFGSPIAGS